MSSRPDNADRPPGEGPGTNWPGLDGLTGRASFADFVLSVARFVRRARG